MTLSRFYVDSFSFSVVTGRNQTRGIEETPSEYWTPDRGRAEILFLRERERENQFGFMKISNIEHIISY